MYCTEVCGGCNYKSVVITILLLTQFVKIINIYVLRKSSMQDVDVNGNRTEWE